MNEQWKTILESKRRERSRLAALSFSEKVVLLEKLRDRALAVAGSPLYGSRASAVGKAWIIRESPPDKRP